MSMEIIMAKNAALKLDPPNNPTSSPISEQVEKLKNLGRQILIGFLIGS